jgi:predicted ATPase
MAKLKQVQLRGFKSIRDAAIDLGALNVLIGANGSGKSNLVSFFRLLNEMMGERLQQFIATHGRAHSLLHHGPKRTPQLESVLQFESDVGVNTYEMRLFYVAGDTLIFADETLQFARKDRPPPSKAFSLGAGHLETRIRSQAEQGQPTAKVFRHLLNTCRVYHFHDTSSTARVRQAGYIGDSRLLMYDAGNLAAFLYRLKSADDTTAYRRIVGTVQLIALFFDDFDLQPTGPSDTEIFLNWREKGSDQLFGPHQLLDGTLRAICLVTLLLQPIEDLPQLIIVDESELGLHPYALNVVAALFQKAAVHTQVLISTQSSSFLDNFEPEDVLVVWRDRATGESTVTRQTSENLAAWLDEYSLGEVWEKNVFAGGPH